LLKLKRVELQGFKSFCDRTELRFNGGGIAAIVGPNGCGKSNLSDAISWVLGEQSAKTLRGSRMEDVIFAGTRDRKPVGMAYVTMTLADPKLHDEPAGPGPVNGHLNGNVATLGSHAAEKPGEITITRRLYRSGESEYLINGRAARLRDIQDIFMGSGLGPESYAIIEQGRIGQILSSKPQDRRAIVEEAAGVTKYKTRRRLAEAKLESAKQNLARVFDILEEVTRQANSLKRQAAKTKRYTELKAEMESRLRVLLSTKHRSLERDAAKAALDLNVASNEVKSLGESVAAKEQEHSELQAAFYETDRQLTGRRQELADANIELERARGRLASQVKESGAIEQRIAQGEKEAQDLAQRVEVVEQEISLHRASVEGLEQELAGVRGRLIEKNREREEVQQQLRSREQAIEAARTAVLRLLGEASALRNQLAQIDEYLAGIEREKSRVAREEEAAAADLDALAAARADLSQRMAERQLELQAVTDDRRRTEEELTVQRRSFSETRQKVDELGRECSHIRARKDSLEQVLSHRTYTTDSVKRLFAALERGSPADFRPIGVLADFVEVDPQFEKPAEEFLHEELEYVVVENWREAEAGIDFLRTDLEGRATFLVHPNGSHVQNGQLPEPAVGPETGILARLSESLRLTNGLKERARDLLPRVSRCFIAEDRAAAQRLSAAYPHLYFLLPEGLCYHGSTVSGGRKTASGPLAMKREARELAAALRVQEGLLQRHTERLEELQADIARLEADLESLRASQQAREKDAVALDHEIRKLGEEMNRSNSRLSVARLELERLRRETERSLEQRERSRAAVAGKEADRSEKEAVLERERESLETLESEAGRIGEEHAVLRAALAGLEERARGENAAMTRLEAHWKEITGRRGRIVPEIERLGEQRARLLADNIDLDQRIGAVAEETSALEARIQELAAREAAMREDLASGEERLRFLRAQAQDAHDRRAHVDVQLVRLQAELKFLDETSRKELNVGVAELAAGDETIPDEETLAETERLYTEIRSRIEALGPVNPAALEEYQEAQQRFDFLSAQRQDLLDSIRDTEKAIQDIDVVSRQKFAEAFEAINAHFQECFRILFGGGHGEMRLTDETNAAESGIDIVASPPGKRLQNVLLLSGGEKSLAAMALLMAIFRYQPSPFCVLDEVDAPLDEANIGRLMRLLVEMANQTQFVLITHSKKTMESAQTLYGVTMQEPGVSKLVSVRFQPAAVAIPA
jgi:chromosome segregation protein